MVNETRNENGDIMIKLRDLLFEEKTLTAHVLSIGVANPWTGSTGYDWNLYDSEWNNKMYAFLTNRRCILFSANKNSFKIGDDVLLRGNDTQRKMFSVKIIDVSKVNKEELNAMLKKHGFDYTPLRPFAKRTNNTQRLQTSYSVKGIQLEGLNEGVWAKMMKGVRAGGSGPWSIVAIKGEKVIGQDINIKIRDLIPAAYEEMKRKYPDSVIFIENGSGQVVWSNRGIKEGVLNEGYKISFDGKKIETIPNGTTILNYVKDKLGLGKIVTDTFTMYDLANGDSKKLIYHITKKPSIEFWVGKDLNTNDLKAKYDSFGSIKK